MSGAVRKTGAKPLDRMNKTELLEACKVAGVSPPEEATNKVLRALLVAKAPEAEAKAPEAEAKAPEAEAKAPEAEAKAEHVVAPGKAVTSRKGILKEGDEVRAEYLNPACGKEALKALVKRGTVVKN